MGSLGSQAHLPVEGRGRPPNQQFLAELLETNWHHEVHMDFDIRQTGMTLYADIKEN